MTKTKLSFKQKMLKMGSWLLLTVGPAIVAAIVVIFSYGKQAQGYIDTIETTKTKIERLEPLVLSSVNEISSINSSLDVLSLRQKADGETLNAVDKNLVSLIAVLDERKRYDDKQKEDLKVWMIRIEDRINNRR